MEIRLEEVEYFGLFTAIMGVGMFLLGAFWDNACGITIRHSQGLGWMQILWCAGWGLYSIWAWSVHSKWREYRKQIHNLLK